MTKAKIPRYAVTWFSILFALALFDGILLLTNATPISGIDDYLTEFEKYLILVPIVIVELIVLARWKQRLHWLVLVDVALTNLIIGHLFW